MASVLVVGATGYVGGRLVPRLLDQGHSVRCLARSPGRLAGREWDVEIVEGDVLKPETLPPALNGIKVAYYLVHSMGSGEKSFEELDQTAARNFARAAKEAGVERVIYLGGLGKGDDLSPHLKSRQEVGEILRQEGPPVVELRAAVIVGSGSISFEMIRSLTERLPVMICPRWVSTRCQPIGIDDVLRYLLQSLDNPKVPGEIIEIGCPNVLTYGEMMKEYARQRKLWRLLIPVPLLTPRLSSYWVDLVTPIPASISRPLIEGLRSEVICTNNKAAELFDFEPLSYKEALAQALSRVEAYEVETIWSTPLSRSKSKREPVELENQEGMIFEKREMVVDADPQTVYKTFMGIGGKRGWFAWNWAWRIRGFIDRLVGGVGMRRGRRHPDDLYPGESLDFWRVEAVEPGKLLRLRAEMKLPGRAWLQFHVEPEGEGARLNQTAFFEPRGLFGLLYWWVLYPFHQMIFSRMIKAVAKRAVKAEDGTSKADESQKQTEKEIHIVH